MVTNGEVFKISEGATIPPQSLKMVVLASVVLLATDPMVTMPPLQLQAHEDQQHTLQTFQT